MTDLALLWQWHRPAAAAPIQLLAWEPPYASGVALQRQKKKKESNCRALGCHGEMDLSPSPAQWVKGASIAATIAQFAAAA